MVSSLRSSSFNLDFDDFLLSLVFNFLEGEEIIKFSRVNKNWRSIALKSPLSLTINVENSYTWYDSEVLDVDQRIAGGWIEKLKRECFRNVRRVTIIGYSTHTKLLEMICTTFELEYLELQSHDRYDPYWSTEMCGIEIISESPLMKNLETLIISDEVFGRNLDIEMFDKPYLVNLKRLELGGCTISSSSLSEAEYLNNIEVLSLDSCLVNAWNDSDTFNFGNLKKVSLANIYCYSNHLIISKILLSGLTNHVESLKFSYQITPKVLEIVCNPKFSKLKELSLDNINDIQTANSSIEIFINNIDNLTELKVLRFGNVPLMLNHVNVLIEKQVFHNLKELQFELGSVEDTRQLQSTIPQSTFSHLVNFNYSPDYKINQVDDENLFDFSHRMIFKLFEIISSLFTFRK